MRVILLVSLVILLNFSPVSSYLRSTRHVDKTVRRYHQKSSSRRYFSLPNFDTSVIQQSFEGVNSILQNALGQTQAAQSTELTSVILSVDINEAVGLNPLGTKTSSCFYIVIRPFCYMINLYAYK